MNRGVFYTGINHRTIKSPHNKLRLGLEQELRELIDNSLILGWVLIMISREETHHPQWHFSQPSAHPWLHPWSGWACACWGPWWARSPSAGSHTSQWRCISPLPVENRLMFAWQALTSAMWTQTNQLDAFRLGSALTALQGVMRNSRTLISIFSGANIQADVHIQVDFQYFISPLQLQTFGHSPGCTHRPALRAPGSQEWDPPQNSWRCLHRPGSVWQRTGTAQLYVW